MKRHFIILCLAILAIGCSKNLVKTKTSFVGKWKLTESLIDPGDGSGKWTAPAENTVIEFTSGGLIKYNTGESDNYKIINDSLMQVSSSSSSTINYSYKMDGNKLFMRPPCIEACGERYIRLK